MCKLLAHLQALNKSCLTDNFASYLLPSCLKIIPFRNESIMNDEVI